MFQGIVMPISNEKEHRKLESYFINWFGGQIAEALKNNNSDNFGTNAKIILSNLKQQITPERVDQVASEIAPETLAGSLEAMRGFLDKKSYVQDVFECSLIAENEQVALEKAHLRTKEELQHFLETATIHDLRFDSKGELEYGEKPTEIDSSLAVVPIKVKNKAAPDDPEQDAIYYLSDRQSTSNEIRGKLVINILKEEKQRSLEPEYEPRTLQQILDAHPAVKQKERAVLAAPFLAPFVTAFAISEPENIAMQETTFSHEECQAKIQQELRNIEQRQSNNLPINEEELEVLTALNNNFELIKEQIAEINDNPSIIEDHIKSKLLSEYFTDTFINVEILDIAQSYLQYCKKNNISVEINDPRNITVFYQLWELSQRRTLDVATITNLFPFFIATKGQHDIKNFYDKDIQELSLFIQNQKEISRVLYEMAALNDTYNLPYISRITEIHQEFLRNPSYVAQSKLVKESLRIAQDLAKNLQADNPAIVFITHSLEKLKPHQYPKTFPKDDALKKMVQDIDSQEKRRVETLQNNIKITAAGLLAQSLEWDIEQLFAAPTAEAQELLKKIASDDDLVVTDISNGEITFSRSQPTDSRSQPTTDHVSSAATTTESVSSEDAPPIPLESITLGLPTTFKLSFKNKQIAQKCQKFLQDCQHKNQSPSLKEILAPHVPIIFHEKALELTAAIEQEDQRQGLILKETFGKTYNTTTLKNCLNSIRTLSNRDITHDFLSATDETDEQQAAEKDHLRKVLEKVTVGDLEVTNGQLRSKEDSDSGPKMLKIFFKENTLEEHTEKTTYFVVEDRYSGNNELRGRKVIALLESAYQNKDNHDKTLGAVIKESPIFDGGVKESSLSYLERETISEMERLASATPKKPLALTPEEQTAFLSRFEAQWPDPLTEETLSRYCHYVPAADIASRPEFLKSAMKTKILPQIYDRDKFYDSLKELASKEESLTESEERLEHVLYESQNVNVEKEREEFIQSQRHIFRTLQDFSQFIEKYAHSQNESFNSRARSYFVKKQQELYDAQMTYIKDNDLQSLRNTVQAIYDGVKKDLQNERNYLLPWGLRQLENIWRAVKKYFAPKNNPSLKAETKRVLKEIAAQDGIVPESDYSNLNSLFASGVLTSFTQEQRVKFIEKFTESQAEMIQQKHAIKINEKIHDAELYLRSMLDGDFGQEIMSQKDKELKGLFAPLNPLNGTNISPVESYKDSGGEDIMSQKDKEQTGLLAPLNGLKCSDIFKVTSNKQSGAVILSLTDGTEITIGNTEAFNQIPEFRAVSLENILNDERKKNPPSADLGAAVLQRLKRISVEAQLQYIMQLPLSMDLRKRTGDNLVSTVESTVTAFLENQKVESITDKKNQPGLVPTKQLEPEENQAVLAAIKQLPPEEKSSLGAISQRAKKNEATTADLMALYLLREYSDGSYVQNRDRKIFARHVTRICGEVYDELLSRSPDAPSEKEKSQNSMLFTKKSEPPQSKNTI